MSSLLNEYRLHQLTDKEIDEYHLQSDKLKQELGYQLEAFCRSINIEANINRVTQEFEHACHAYSEQPITIAADAPLLNMTIKIAATQHLKTELSLAVESFLKHLAHDIVNDSVKLPRNSRIFRGSLTSVCRKMILFYSRPDVSLRDIEHFNIEHTFSCSIRELSFDNLLSQTMSYYRDNYHRYRLWDAHAISLLALFLFESREYFQPLEHQTNLSYLLADTTPVPIVRFKQLCIAYWNENGENPFVSHYTEQAFPDKNGIIFAEYVPLEHISEQCWQQLYALYLDRCK
ncbi:hypothetical protein BIY22_00295 [Vibrio panuliri]|uniref:Uncharacterized protein n=1 Tax=Vibrio panuliri TaxID=1381081 RepID=A0A1Q9HQ63_9VIBR|nr:hypothetical protein [Vibrio panuliri]OLQ92972.1 hypothetical protein BIY22_00295 [Vibrio panuliri]